MRSSSASEESVWVFGLGTVSCVAPLASGCEVCVVRPFLPEAGGDRGDTHVLGHPGVAVGALVRVAWVAGVWGWPYMDTSLFLECGVGRCD